MATVKQNKVKTYLLLLILLAIYIGMFFALGPGVYNDSDQYIKMHIHREPLYPLILLLFRTLCGERWLIAVGIFQGVFTAVSVWFSTEYISRKFLLTAWQRMIVVALFLCPFFVTIVFSQTRLFIPNSIMSEAICMPLFLLFFIECFEMMTTEGKKQKKATLVSLLLAFLMSLTRSQMMAIAIVWLMTIGIKIVITEKEVGKKLLQLSVAIVVVATFLGIRMLAVKTYNSVFNGHFTNNTYGGVNTLTNVLYASDRIDGESIKDEEAKKYFYIMYDTMRERGAGYQDAEGTWTEKVCHLERWHDVIKYEMIEDLFFQTFRETEEYIDINIKADELSVEIIKGILPKCFDRWFANYLLLAVVGMIRSIAVDSPVINWIALLIYVSAVLSAFFMVRENLKKGEQIDESVWLFGVALLLILGNVFTVAITIMPLSRYVVYGFSPFYVACFVLGINWMRRLMKKKGMKYGIQKSEV